MLLFLAIAMAGLATIILSGMAIILSGMAMSLKRIADALESKEKP